MLLLAASFAHAQILDAGILGAMVGVHDSGDVAVGPAVLSLPGGVSLYALFGAETEELSALRTWEAEVGGWAPDYLGGRSKRKTAAASKKNQRPGEKPAEDPAPKLVRGGPRLALGGNAWEAERLHATLGGDGLVNLLGIAGTPDEDAYAGLAFGGASRVRYREEAPVGEGALLVHAGLGGGVRVADAAIFRLVADAELEPLVLDLRLRADVLVGVSLLPADAPVALQLRGKGELAPLEGWAASWEVHVALGFTSD